MYYMDFSLSTYCLFSEPLITALDTLSQHATHLELMNEAMHQTQDVKLLQNYPVSYTIHSPFMNMNISSPKEEDRIRSIQRIETSINLAAEIEAKYVVVHPGTYSENSSRISIGIRSSLQFNGLVGSISSNFILSIGILELYFSIRIALYC